MDELIRKQDAIDAAIKADMENHNGILSEKRARVLEEHIAILPPVQPKTGHWVHDGTACYCSECKKSQHKDYNKWDVFSPGVWILSDFCPHCGADMRGEQDEY